MEGFFGGGDDDGAGVAAEVGVDLGDDDSGEEAGGGVGDVEQEALERAEEFRGAVAGEDGVEGVGGGAWGG